MRHTTHKRYADLTAALRVKEVAFGHLRKSVEQNVLWAIVEAFEHSVTIRVGDEVAGDVVNRRRPV